MLDRRRNSRKLEPESDGEREPIAKSRAPKKAAAKKASAKEAVEVYSVTKPPPMPTTDRPVFVLGKSKVYTSVDTTPPPPKSETDPKLRNPWRHWCNPEDPKVRKLTPKSETRSVTQGTLGFGHVNKVRAISKTL